MVTTTQDRLKDILEDRFQGRSLILASNRGPVEYYRDAAGNLEYRRGSGGIVSALSGLSRHTKIDWIASAMTEGDRAISQSLPDGWIAPPLEGLQLRVKYLLHSRKAYHKYYSIFSNPLLWFLQHYMWNASRSPNIDRVAYDAWHTGYVTVNEAFATAVIDDAMTMTSPPVIMLHDYHLYLSVAYIRHSLPEAFIQHFTHIPWPEPTYWQLLPSFMCKAIHTSLCSANIVGLQTERDVLNFLLCCQYFIRDAQVDYVLRQVTVGQHTCQVKAYPVSIDVPAVKRLLKTSRIAEHRRRLAPLFGEKTIMRVDRLEPSKNIIRGFNAYDILLARHPELIGKIKFLAFLVPTRTHLKQYRRYTEDTLAKIDEVNKKYGQEGWQPIEYFYENNYAQAIAAMCSYDVLLVNAVIDGMNLVAKEGPVVNGRDGVLVLSENVGAREQLGENALLVSPADIEGTVEALYQALMMPEEEKARRSQALKLAVEKEDINTWLMQQLTDISLSVSD